MAHKACAYVAVALCVLLVQSAGQAHAQESSPNQTQEEQQVGIFYGIGQSFQVSQLVSLIPARIRSMASCVQRVGSGHEVKELRDEVSYMIELLQKNSATGPVMNEMEMIFTDSTQALMALPNVARKPYSELTLDDLLVLRDAAFNLVVLPIRLNRLRDSLMLALTNTDLYGSEFSSEIRKHLGSQLSVAARIGQEVFRCRGSSLAVATTTAAAPAITQRPRSTQAEIDDEDGDVFDF
ncbi:uncharacterized protein LOC100900975 [Galendromus occidentalis]|uniref:Uncharacterized protein LOC100900975 n=1 Tax=Galendromus occidentalis TaxID=34638 RepID=A0AAJ6QT35_9ACAR|nr:uncharacterized protein LOC100900975 [Galendromus occidentalis]